ncbi:response regulator, partial [bacterium]|nr:response regulator [bacterium]
CNNFVHNAVKFTDNGSVTIKVRRETYRDDKTWICVSVTDTGIGIKSEELKNIFLPYSQSDGSATRRYGGTGLGLSISEKIAELLQGDIGVHSNPGQGSEFYARFAVTERGTPWQGRLSGMPNYGHRVAVYAGSDAIRASCVSLAKSCGLSVYSAPSKSALRKLLQSSDEAVYVLIYPSVGLASSADELLACEALDGLSVPTVYVGDFCEDLKDYAGELHYLNAPLRRADFIASLAAWSKSANDSVEVEVPERFESNYPSEFVGRKILVVEDNPVNQRLAKLMLETFSMKVTVASHGAEALSLAKNQLFDLVLMDCQMPVMNGFDATQSIRQIDSANRLVPIIAMTANSDPQDQALCYRAGMNAVLPKPFRLSELADMLTNWLV